MQPVWAVGLMTGTVLDGNIDVALVRTDGNQITEFGPFDLMPYPEEINAMLRQALDEARAWNFEGAEPEIFQLAETALTDAQTQAVIQLVQDAGLSLKDVGAVGFHGQSVLHRAPHGKRKGQTRQLGDGNRMNKQLGVSVVYDFRSADMKAGGQGAPLSAIYHKALLHGLDAKGEKAVLNLGGVANITWSDGSDKLVAFDTGPANAPTNDFMKIRGLGTYDRDGKLALSGNVNEARLEQLLAHSYFDTPFPKSLDRFDFSAEMVEGLSDAEGAATLAAFTASAVAKALDQLPVRPTEIVVSGGGRKNPAMMKALIERTKCNIVQCEQYGWRGDALEAECFGLLAVRVLQGMPISFPTTTGVPQPMVGGQIAR